MCVVHFSFTVCKMFATFVQPLRCFWFLFVYLIFFFYFVSFWQIRRMSWQFIFFLFFLFVSESNVWGNYIKMLLIASYMITDHKYWCLTISLSLCVEILPTFPFFLFLSLAVRFAVCRTSNLIFAKGSLFHSSLNGFQCVHPNHR